MKMNQQAINKLNILTKKELIDEIVALKNNGISKSHIDSINIKETAVMIIKQKYLNLSLKKRHDTPGSLKEPDLD